MRVFSALQVVILLLLCSGCADMRDINERAYVLGVGIDPAEDGGSAYTFCCYLPRLPGASTTGEKMTTAAICIEADSMAEAVRRLDQSTSRETVLEQLACIAIGSHPDCDELERLLDYPLREPQVRRQAVVVAAAGCTARELMSTEPGEGSAPAAIASLLAQQSGGGRVTQPDALYRVGQLLADGCDIMLRRIGLMSDGGDTSQSDAARRLIISGADVYTGGSCVGSLTERQAEAAGLINGATETFMLSVSDTDGAPTIYTVRPVSQSVTCEIIDDVPVFDISLQAEYSAADLGGGEEADRAKINAALSHELERLTLECRQTLGSAPLGLETLARQQQWRWYSDNRAEWSEAFSACNVRLHVYCTPTAGQAVDIRTVT